MMFGFLVAFSPLLLEDKFHSALCVLDNSRFHFDRTCGDSWVPAEGKFTGTKLVDFV